MLADSGYAVFAVDLFGAGVRPARTEDRRQQTGRLYQDRKRMRTLLDGAFKAARAPLLILHGTADNSVSMDDFAGLATQLDKAGVAHEMITYGAAPHAFTVFNSERYRKGSDRKSWSRLTAFLRETTGGTKANQSD